MADDALDLKVPTRELEVELAVEGSAPRRLELFLPAPGAEVPAHEALRGHLGAGGRFMPARDPETGKLVLVSRGRVLWAAVERPEAERRAQLEMDLYDVRYPVRLELAGGGALEGELLYSPPSAQARVLDHLNGSGPFLCLFQWDRVLVVNASRVVTAQER